MSHDHGADYLLHGLHICMWESPSFSPSATEINHNELKLVNQSNLEEIQRLRALLDVNNISWAKAAAPIGERSNGSPRDPSQLPVTRARAAKMKAIAPIPLLPHLPSEILVRILALVVTQSDPIIDPFWKQRPENKTKEEQKRPAMNLEFLAICRAFKVEGTRLLIAHNSFVFTQLEALQNFANMSLEFRSVVSDVTLRIVGKYYDASSGKRSLYGDSPYHEEHSAPTVWVNARPSGSGQEKGVQGYCWQQVADFAKSLITYSADGQRNLLFPALQSLRIDMVNFCEHLPFLGSTLISILRWHVGPIVNELTITGFLHDDLSGGEERYLEFLVRDEGVIILTPPTFVSVGNSKNNQRLKVLPSNDDYLMIKLVRSGFKSKESNLGDSKQKTAVNDYPKGKTPPISIHDEGVTIWKWTSDSLNSTKKKWVEFHRGCGLPVTLCGELMEENDSNAEGDEEGGALVAEESGAA